MSLLTASAALVRALALAGLVIAFPASSHAQDRAPKVTTATAEMAPVTRELRLTGSVTSPRIAQISTSVGGLVESVHVDSGDRVKAGAPLIDLDREIEALELRRAKAATREAREELADVRRRLAEAKRVVADHGISESEVRSLEAEVRIAAAVVERLEAEEQRQAERVERHSVSAPFAGVVARKHTAPGEWIEPGTAVVELVDLNGLRLDFQAPQAYYPRIEAETDVSVRLDALPDRELDGRVTATIPVSDPDARTFTVRVHLNDESVPMTPGMSARARLDLDAGRKSVVVPRDALIRYPDGRVTVWVVNAGGKGDLHEVHERQVDTGLIFDGRVEIRSGLDETARVVVRGNEALEEGQAVRVEEGS